jgi:hypothetical protein
MNKVEKTGEKKKYRLDIIFIAAILTVSLVAVGIMLLTRREGAEVVVSVGGKEVGRYSLAENGEYSVNGGSNVFVIENGEVYMKTATCHGYQDCIEAGKIKYKNETIVCLPNKVELRIVGEAPEKDVELVS